FIEILCGVSFVALLLAVTGLILAQCATSDESATGSQQTQRGKTDSKTSKITSELLAQKLAASQPTKKVVNASASTDASLSNASFQKKKLHKGLTKNLPVKGQPSKLQQAVNNKVSALF